MNGSRFANDAQNISEKFKYVELKFLAWIMGGRGME
jgi:hypothetical protein